MRNYFPNDVLTFLIVLISTSLTAQQKGILLEAIWDRNKCKLIATNKLIHKTNISNQSIVMAPILGRYYCDTMDKGE